MSSTLVTMDFSNAGATERAGDAFRVHINWRVNGKQRNAYGPRRPDEETAKDALESMRAAANGESREEGFAAMAAEAKVFGILWPNCIIFWGSKAAYLRMAFTSF